LDANFPENGGIVPAEIVIATFTIFCYWPDLIFRLIFLIWLGAAHISVACWPGSTGSPNSRQTLRVGNHNAQGEET